jgi:hypothetical protein
MDKTPSLFGTPRDWAMDLAIATGIGAFLGVIGPFGSFDGAGLEVRLFYWIANLWIGFVMLSIIVRLSLKAGTKLDIPLWFALPVGTAIGAVPLGFTIALFSALAWPPNHGRVSALDVWYLQTLAISEPCAFFYYFLTGKSGRYTEHYEFERRGGASAPTTAAGAATDAAAFLNRLPPRLGRELLCLQMEDHYVRAHTALGSDLLLLPLKDAVAEVGGIEGMQVHRSWWVARGAVERVIEDGRNLRLGLTGGLEAPVSRSAVASLRAAGWFKRPADHA